METPPLNRSALNHTRRGRRGRFIHPLSQVNKATPEIVARWRYMHELRKTRTLQQIADMTGVSLWMVWKCIVKYQSYLLNEAKGANRNSEGAASQSPTPPARHSGDPRNILPVKITHPTRLEPSGKCAGGQLRHVAASP